MRRETNMKWDLYLCAKTRGGRCCVALCVTICPFVAHWRVEFVTHLRFDMCGVPQRKSAVVFALWLICMWSSWLNYMWSSWLLYMWSSWFIYILTRVEYLSAWLQWQFPRDPFACGVRDSFTFGHVWCPSAHEHSGVCIGRARPLRKGTRWWECVLTYIAPCGFRSPEKWRWRLSGLGRGEWSGEHRG